MFKVIFSTFLICIVLMGSAGISLVERVLASEQEESCCITEVSPCCNDTNEMSGCCEDEIINLHVKFDFCQHIEYKKFTTETAWNPLYIFSFQQTNFTNTGNKVAVNLTAYPPPCSKHGIEYLKENQQFRL
jgi:hypothetical protein